MTPPESIICFFGFDGRHSYVHTILDYMVCGGGRVGGGRAQGGRAEEQPYDNKFQLYIYIVGRGWAENVIITFYVETHLNI